MKDEKLIMYELANAWLSHAFEQFDFGDVVGVACAVDSLKELLESTNDRHANNLRTALLSDRDEWKRIADETKRELDATTTVLDRERAERKRAEADVATYRRVVEELEASKRELLLLLKRDA